MQRRTQLITILNLLAMMIIVAFLLSENFSLVKATSCEEMNCNKDDSEEDYKKCIEKKKSCLESKINETTLQSNTLKNTISILDGQIVLQQIKVNQTINDIEDLEEQIAELSQRIEGLGVSLDNLAAILIERVKESYKQTRTTSPLNLLASDSFNMMINEEQYLARAELQTVKTMQMAEYQRINYNKQKEDKEKKQVELEAKKKELEAQKRQLDLQKNSKQNLLSETQNNEAKYQQLLSQAIAELNSLKSFVKSQVGDQTCLASSPGQADGWYWSQRDPQWCQKKIGNSNEIIGDVGCLISSVAMIWTKHGQRVSPADIASNPSYFSVNTAYMRSPLPSPNGYSYAKSNVDFKLIDNELASGRPVIVHLKIGTADGHFIVLKNGSNGNYVMNDPLLGADLKFSDHYGTYMIDSLRIFKPG